MTHKNKLRLARRMMSKDEIKRHISPFLSNWWTNQKWVKHLKIIKKHKLKQYVS